MRIISKFQDYYDSAMAYGQDQSVIYHREETEVVPREFQKQKIYPIYLGVEDRSYWSERTLGIWNAIDSLIVYKCTIVFCGRVWNALAVRDGHELTYFYDFPEFKKFIESRGKTLIEKPSRWSRGSNSVETHYRNWFMDQGTEKYRDQLIQDRIIVASNHRTITSWGSQGHYIVTNGCLKDAQFFKVMDAFTAYQEIDMWISGVLPKDGPPMVEVTDKDKVSKHGFDKSSFRKAPTKKR